MVFKKRDFKQPFSFAIQDRPKGALRRAEWRMRHRLCALSRRLWSGRTTALSHVCLEQLLWHAVYSLRVPLPLVVRLLWQSIPDSSFPQTPPLRLSVSRVIFQLVGLIAFYGHHAFSLLLNAFAQYFLEAFVCHGLMS